MKQNLFTYVTNFKKIKIALLSVVFFHQIAWSQAPCTNPLITTPIIDVRGDTDLCSGNRLELCPSLWGYSNYQWFKDGMPFSFNSCIVVTQVGSYTLSAQDGTGCWSLQSSPVNAIGSSVTPSTPTISTSSALIFCNSNYAILTSSSSTGNQWYKDGIAINGATYQNLTTNESGDYSVVVSNCGNSSAPSNTITLTVSSSPAAGSISGNNNLCTSQTSQLTNTASGGSWSSSNTTVATVDANGLVTALSAGNSTISYAVTNGTCTNETSITIYVASTTAPTLDVRGSTDLCVNSSLEICPSTWGYSNYEWYKDGNLFSTNSCITISTPGSYTLRAQNSNSCWTLQSSAVVVTGGATPTTPIISTSSALNICSNSTALLTSSSSTGNQWYKDGIAISGATSSTYNANATGAYSVMVTNCGSSSSPSNVINLNVALSPNVSSITGNNSLCIGNTTQLNNDSTGGVWTSSNNAVATVDVNGLVTAISSGNATITYTITDGICSASATFGIIVNGATTPIISVSGSTTICSSIPTQLCPSTFGASNYQWYKDGIAFSTNACINVVNAGSYTLEVSNGSCTSSQSAPVVITVGTPPSAATISAGGITTFCEGSSVLLSSTIAANYQWNLNGSPIYGATSATYLATTSGSYTVSTTGCGSSTSNAITVTVDALPIVGNINGVSTLCNGFTTTYTNTTAGGTWSSSNTSVATIDASGLITTIAAGTTTISYTVTNGTCTTVKTKVFSVFPIAITPTINPRSSTTFCEGSNVQMCPLNWGYSNYEWYKDGILFSTTSCITATLAGSYTLKAQNGAGCWSAESNAVAVTVNPKPVLDATTGATSICVGSSTLLSNTTIIPSGGSSSWSSTQGRASVNASTGNVTGLTAGTANIRYTVTNSFGCSNFVDYTVVVNALPNTPTISYAPGYPNPQSGSAFCTNRTFGLLGSPTGGVWSSTGVVSITSGGIVTTTSTTGSGSVTYSFTNVNGCTNSRTISSNVVACAPRGVTVNNNSLNTDSKITIFPNPCKNYFNINTKNVVGTYEIIVTDLYGKQYFKQYLSIGNNKVDVANLPSGYYLVTVTNKKESITERLIIE